MRNNSEVKVPSGGQPLLCGVSGPAAGMRAALGIGHTLTVGRGEHNTVPLPQDGFLSGAHFSITQAATELRLRDLGSRNGTRVNGVLVQECLLREGDEVHAGNSRFLVTIGPEEFSPQARFLTSQPDPLYAVLDAARDPDILPLLQNSGQPFFSLYFGQAADDLKTVAPYLVPLPPKSEVLNSIVAGGWAHSWGIFLTCGEPLAEIWKQLRRSLMVSLQGTQEQVYFRFYDPRVFRVFFRVSTPQQRVEFTGPIRNFFVEDDDPAVILQYSAGCNSATTHTLSQDKPRDPSAKLQTQRPATISL